MTIVDCKNLARCGIAVAGAGIAAENTFFEPAGFRGRTISLALQYDPAARPL